MQAAPTEQAPAGPPRRAEAQPAVAAGVVVGVLLLVALVVGRRLWFFSDDWNIFADYHSGNLLEPFNGHLSLVPAGVYQALFHTIGMAGYLPYRIAGLASLGVLGFQVARYARTRVGPWVAVLAVAGVLWNSAGTTNVMFPFLMNFSLPIAALVAIWWHLDREAAERSTAGGRPATHLVAAGVWLGVALACSGLGVMAAAAVLVELTAARAPLRRWLAFAPAAALWFVWWLGHRGANELSTDLGAVVPYAARMLWAGPTSLAAGWKPGGLLLGAALVVVLVVGWRRSRAGPPPGDSGGPRPSPPTIAPRILGALAAAIAFAGLTALTRQDVTPSIAPDELRYGWTIGAYLVLAAVAAWRPAVSPSGDRRPNRGWATTAGAVAVGVLAVGAVRLVGDMEDWTDLVASSAPGLRSNLYAAEAAGAQRLPPDVVIRPLSFVAVTAGSYLDAVHDVGSPLAGADAEEVGGRTDQRTAADELFFGALDLELQVVPVPASSEGQPECAGEMQARPGEVVLVVAGPSSAGSLSGPTVAISRFGAAPAVELPVEGTGVANTLVLPEDAPVGTDAVIPYRLEGRGGVEVCITP